MADNEVTWTVTVACGSFGERKDKVAAAGYRAVAKRRDGNHISELEGASLAEVFKRLGEKMESIEFNLLEAAAEEEPTRPTVRTGRTTLRGYLEDMDEQGQVVRNCSTGSLHDPDVLLGELDDEDLDMPVTVHPIRKGTGWEVQPVGEEDLRRFGGPIYESEPQPKE